MKQRKIGYVIVLIALVGLAYFAWLHRYTVGDWVRLRSYVPSEQVAAIAANSKFSGYGERLFYVNNPEILDKQAFNQQCGAVELEQTIVLGCYKNPGIYVYNVTDARLDGIKEVTAAHEMLHAAYERLTPRERKKIDSLTQAAYEKISDPELTKRIDGYKITEPDDIPNELHSILATEVRNIGPELEAYYKKYFIDRLVIVALAEKYEKVFVDIKDQVERYDAELVLHKAEITQREKQLEQTAAELQVQRQQLDTYLTQKRYANYNQLVPSYNKAVNAFNDELEAVRGIIREYNKLVEARNQLAANQQELAESIDSRIQSITP